MSPAQLSRLGKRAALLGAVVLGFGELAGCSDQSAGALEHQACVVVAQSLVTFQKAEANPDRVSAQVGQAKALSSLRAALQPAALAAAQSGDYQALAATLSESSRVPEVELVQALAAQCAAPLSSS